MSRSSSLPTLPSDLLLQYSWAILKGGAKGTYNFLKTWEHPIDNVLYPTSLWVLDAVTILGYENTRNHDDPEIRAFFSQVGQNKELLYAKSSTRMQERIGAIEKYGTTFIASDGPRRAEMISELCTGVYLNGRLLSSFNTAATVLRNKATFGTFREPVKFNVVAQEFETKITTPPSVKLMTIDEIRACAGREKYLCVITGESVPRFLVAHEESLSVYHAIEGGHLRPQYFITHDIVGDFKPVHFAGEIYIDKGRIAPIETSYFVEKRSGEWCPIESPEKCPLLQPGEKIVTEKMGGINSASGHYRPVQAPGSQPFAQMIEHFATKFGFAAGEVHGKFYSHYADLVDASAASHLIPAPKLSSSTLTASQVFLSAVATTAAKDSAASYAQRLESFSQAARATGSRAVSASVESAQRFIGIKIIINDRNPLEMDPLPKNTDEVFFRGFDTKIEVHSAQSQQTKSVKVMDLTHDNVATFGELKVSDQVEIHFMKSGNVVALPKEMGVHLINFLQQYKPNRNKDYCCVDFACEMAVGRGIYQRCKAESHALDEKKLTVGDVVYLNDGSQPNRHAAIYLGDHCYLSLLGRGGPLFVTTLSEMKRGYKIENGVHLTSFARVNDNAPDIINIIPSQPQPISSVSSTNEAAPKDYRIGVSAQQQPRPSQSHWNPLNMLIPAILRSELQASENPDTSSSGQSSQEVKNMRQGQYCTSIEFARFLRKQPNLTATLEEAKAFGMPDWMLEKAKLSGLITVSDGKLLLSPEAFCKQFPTMTASVEDFDLLTLDRKNQSFTRKAGVSAEQVREFLIPKLKLFA